MLLLPFEIDIDLTKEVVLINISGSETDFTSLVVLINVMFDYCIQLPSTKQGYSSPSPSITYLVNE